MRQGAGALIDRYGRRGRTPLMTAIAAGGTVLLVGTRCVAAEVLVNLWAERFVHRTGPSSRPGARTRCPA